PYYLKFGVDQTVQNGCNCENSSYNSLEWVVEKRFSHGYSLNSAFTWSKAIDMRDAPNPANRRSGRGLSQYDRAAAWILSHSWELPWGRGKPFGSTAGGVTKAALAGWQFSGITTLESGFPFTPVLSNNSTLNADFGQRPDVIRNWGVPEQTRAH